MILTLALLGSIGGADFYEGLANRMSAKASSVLAWASRRGAHVCVSITVEGADPDGELFDFTYLICQ